PSTRRGNRGQYRAIYTAMLDDPDFQKLPSDARLVLLVARLCQDAGPAAIYRYYPEILARRTGLEDRRVVTCLRVLKRGAWVDFDDSVLWIRNGLRFDPMLRLSDDKHRKSIEAQLRALPKSEVVASFCRYYEIARPYEGSAQGHRSNENER